MRKKELSCIFSFETTTQAMAMENACKKKQIPGRIIPFPKEISAGCGLAWWAPAKEKERILAFMASEQLVYEQCDEILF